MLKHLKRVGIISGLSATLLLAACGGSDKNDTDNGKADYGKEMNYTITGIEPGAGISVSTEKAIEAYDNLQGWSVDLSSTGAMMSELEKSIKNKDPIIITGWNPHWMFARYPDMKYLEDPKGIFGDEETINSLARIGLEEDKPEAYKLIDQFQWDVEDMEEIMYEAQDTGKEIEEVAAQWVEENNDKVSEWITDVGEGKGEEIELVSTPWDSERASASVLKEVMEQKGFKVTVTPVDVAIVFETIANGDADATLAAWLPITHKDFYEKHQDNIVDLGPNLTGAKIGLVVPEYMDIDSIEDLDAK